jgi:hypothetical protein
MQGWIRLERKIKDNWLWEDKPFSKGQAFIDLILMANHKDATFPFGDELITVERGSFITSELKLMERWGWSKSKVRYFLNSLEIDSMLVKKSDRKKTTISIVNYSVYQDYETTEEPQKDHKKTIERPIKDTNNNENNVNNVNYNTIVDLYNQLCPSFPKLSKLSDARKKAINARLKIHTIDDFRTLFEKAENSKFLKGTNDRNWSATFDWLIKDSNMVKVLDGNYDDSNKSNIKPFVKSNTNKFNQFPQRDYTATDYQSMEERLLNRN